jgi:hypothetical protein
MMAMCVHLAKQLSAWALLGVAVFIYALSFIYFSLLYRKAWDVYEKGSVNCIAPDILE